MPRMINLEAYSCMGKSGYFRSKACTPVNSSMLMVRSPHVARSAALAYTSHPSRIFSSRCSSGTRRATSSGSGAAEDPLFEQTGRVSWRNLPNNASDFQFVSDFSSGPLTDRASCSDRSLTRECCHLTALPCRKLGSRPRTRSILQPFCQAQCLQVNPLESCPAIPPQAYSVHANIQLADNLCIRRSLSSREHRCALAVLLAAHARWRRIIWSNPCSSCSLRTIDVACFGIDSLFLLCLFCLFSHVRPCPDGVSSRRVTWTASLVLRLKKDSSLKKFHREAPVD